MNKSIIKRAGIAAILVVTLGSCSSSGSSDTSEGSTSETASESSETSPPSKIDSKMNVSVKCALLEKRSGNYWNTSYEVTATNYTNERASTYIEWDILDEAGEYFQYQNAAFSLPAGATRTSRQTMLIEPLVDITGDLKCEVTEAKLRK